MTRAERKALTALDAEIAALEEKTNDPENEDENLWSQEEALQEKRRALIAQTEHWDSELIKHAGVVVRINHDGQPHFTYGVIAKADQAKVNRLLAARAPEGQAPAAEVASEDAAPSGPKLPKSIARELTLARTQALRVEVATRPHVGLALAVFALVQSLRQARHEGVNVSVREAAFADHDALETQRAAMLCSLPDDPIVLLDWCFAHDETALLATLSIVIASALDFAHEGASAADRTLHDRADRIAAEVGLDMHRFWTADTSFFARLPKTMLLEIVTSSMANKPAKRRDQQIAVFAKLKREALAKSANRIAKGQWLPGLLITPAMDASVQRSQDGEIDAARIAAE